ncbi:hypothetical protein GCM10020367_72830 [Streptomyces sannanensis]|uniref:Resolvase/invertase-type recombinase catalytic domain-containing protein n=1 Tax=Streptomyces sannanensis TaxID=285536 RepID=A0ABP6SPB9_9ACTN
MANLVYKRVSTDQQSTDRQNLVLDEAGIEDPVVGCVGFKRVLAQILGSRRGG